MCEKRLFFNVLKVILLENPLPFLLFDFTFSV